MKVLLKGGRVMNPAADFDETADVLIENGKVAKIAKDIPTDDADVYDVTGKLVTPGLIDLHVHFREPGQEAKEDFESGSKAAVAGGFTTVATMPNTNPVVDSAALVRSLKKRAEDVARCHVEIIGAVTKGQQGKELAELGDMVQAGAVAFSDDGHFDPTAKVLLNAYDYLHAFDKVIINHEEETSLVEDGVMNEGHRSAMLGMKGRPTVAEDIAVARDVMLAEYAGARVHVAHRVCGHHGKHSRNHGERRTHDRHRKAHAHPSALAAVADELVGHVVLLACRTCHVFSSQDELVEGDAERLGDGDDHFDVGQVAAVLPIGDRLPRHPKARRELLLREARADAHGLDPLAKFHEFLSLPGPSFTRAKTPRKKA